MRASILPPTGQKRDLRNRWLRPRRSGCTRSAQRPGGCGGHDRSRSPLEREDDDRRDLRLDRRRFARVTLLVAFLLEPPLLGAAAVAELRRREQRPFDLVVDLEPGTHPSPWQEAGATWILTDFGPQPNAARVRDVIEHNLQ
jgi:hypothetical protein